ncbi:uncharacterized protein [Ptychodera flava]|uniref:uncharacterized protein n=1 Tax=Ptychodera flava TaxID=63121 RepID=UPI00396A6F64
MHCRGLAGLGGAPELQQRNITRIRQEGVKHGRTPGRILLDELKRRGKHCTVKTVEDCLIIMERHDVLEVLRKCSLAGNCTFTCTCEIAGQEHIDLTCLDVCKEMTVEGALQGKLEKKNLKKEELYFEDIPGIGVNWNDKVGKFKGYHVKLHRREAPIRKDNFENQSVARSDPTPPVREDTSKNQSVVRFDQMPPGEEIEAQKDERCQLQCTLKMEDMPIDLSVPDVETQVTLRQALGDDLKINGLSVDHLEFEEIPCVTVNWEVSVGQVKNHHLIIRKKETRSAREIQSVPLDDEDDDHLVSHTPFGKEEVGKTGETLGSNSVFTKTVHPEGEVSGISFMQPSPLYDEAISSTDDVSAGHGHRPLCKTASGSSLRTEASAWYDQSANLDQPEQERRRLANLPPGEAEDLYMPLFKSAADRERFLASQDTHCKTDEDQHVTPYQPSSGTTASMASSTTAITIAETAVVMENEAENDYSDMITIPSWHPHLPDAKEEITRVMGEYLQQDGWYLVRETKEKYVAVSVTYCRKIRHFRLYKKRGEWYFYRSGPRMKSLEKLLAWYGSNQLPIKQNSAAAASDAGPPLTLRHPIPVDKDIEKSHKEWLEKSTVERFGQ